MSHNKVPRRSVDGVLLLNKPLHVTSNAALQTVKKLFRARKAGHTGSLDPLATGMLPLCFGEATKFSQFLLAADKTYQVSAQFGIKTTTGDAEGEVIAEKPVPEYSQEQLDAVIEQFTGRIEQIPSMYSALKHQGKPLYYWARQGVTVPREPREVMIYSLKQLDYQASVLRLSVSCSKGTYIRTLVEDIGDALGCGAHVAALHRPTVANYEEQQMVSIETLQACSADPDENFDQAALDGHLLSIDSMLTAWPRFSISRTLAFYLFRGSAIRIPNVPSSGYVAVYLDDQHFLGVGEVSDDGRVAPKRLVKVSTIQAALQD